MRRGARAGFTLIELLICVSIMIVLAPLFWSLMTRMEQLWLVQADRREALASAREAAAAWREDVELARGIEVGPGGSWMEVEVGGEGEAGERVRYAMDEAGRLARVGDGERRVLTGTIEGLQFEAGEGAWTMRYTATARDGVHTWRRGMGAMAAPLGTKLGASPANAGGVR